MPGPKMGPRPADFDEDIVRHSPTFLKWLTLEDGERLRYACREFVRGHGDDEERLMRRIMIARRNNLRDHETLKKARAATTQDDDVVPMGFAPTVAAAPVQQQEEEHPFERKSKRRKQASATVDDQVVKEMDVAAVEATRSYRAWLALEDGKEFVYNQKYVKGKPTHDWLLRKNIWRRMRYRRENKKMVQALVGVDGDDTDGNTSDGGTVTKNEMNAADQADNDAAESAAAGIVDDALLASAAAAADDNVQNIHKSVVDAAVAAAESYVKSVDENTLKGTNIETV